MQLQKIGSEFITGDGSQRFVYSSKIYLSGHSFSLLIHKTLAIILNSQKSSSLAPLICIHLKFNDSPVKCWLCTW